MITTITGANELTITATAGTTYKIEYETSTAVDILNATSGGLYVNSTGNYDTADGTSNYMLLPEGTSYNGYRPNTALGSAIYIFAESGGKICVTVKGY